MHLNFVRIFTLALIYSSSISILPRATYASPGEWVIDVGCEEASDDQDILLSFENKVHSMERDFEAAGVDPLTLHKGKCTIFVGLCGSSFNLGLSGIGLGPFFNPLFPLIWEGSIKAKAVALTIPLIYGSAAAFYYWSFFDYQHLNEKYKKLYLRYFPPNPAPLLLAIKPELRALKTKLEKDVLSDSERERVFKIGARLGCAALMRSVLEKYPDKTKILNSLPGSTEKCSICLMSFDLSQEEICETTPFQGGMTKRGCGHVFHRGCIIGWYCSSKMCPLCRNDSNVDLTPLENDWDEPSGPSISADEKQHQD